MKGQRLKRCPSTSRRQEGLTRGIDAEAIETIAAKAKRRGILDGVIVKKFFFF